MSDAEVDAIVKISEILAPIADEGVRTRILRWACDKYATSGAVAPGVACAAKVPADTPVSVADNKKGELPGIAMLSEDGQFKLTVRDPKAKTTNDAALRIALVTIRACQKLMRTETVSSKGVLIPTLKHWRAYDANTRNVLRQHKGIVRNGDMVTLDAHAILEADNFMAEMLNEEVIGSWKPGPHTRKKAIVSPSSNDGGTPA